ncbi:MAG: pyruvate kinase [Candidatus Kerfeldbacteria bacterium RIFCSPHIGHO2_12_FULL_48_17]|uniref:Pyruvate kinase n=1 Tax=Candidatus Kerfeldbacteria bacterium RIFCSPHIGHO2_12_FULL_48_17 TaxID=1798542 RepID=A0A1G2B0X0_9BACT|nr:MAG: pyruvate kinase [Candidatus Kerfeldbacteria bacterium RIFCSPHIGHO2_12_FULL_48_17]
MDVTRLVPNVPLSGFKHTKIIATLGPATNNYEAVFQLIEAGANGLRLNFSHGTHAEHEQQIKWIRKASKSYGKPVAIIQDLQGPKIRLGDFDGIINVTAGQSLVLGYNCDYAASGIIPIQYDLSKKVKRGEQLLLYDGKIRTIVTSVAGEKIHLRAENDGILIKRKGINLPDTDFGSDVITDKDKRDIIFGSTNDIDYVAQSFVQKPHDITALRALLESVKSDAKIIAKIETAAAMENIEAIIQEADAVMVARGDLAQETLPEAVPIAQRQIIGLGLHWAKPTIVATQLLASMVDQPQPSRAEVADIAAAVVLGTDCLMLSDETTIGRYPIEAVKVLKRVVKYTEKNNPVKVSYPELNYPQGQQNAIPSAIINLARNVDAQAIVAETKSGATALNIAAQRSPIPLIAVTSDSKVAQQLAIVYGIKSYVRPVDKLAATKLTNWLLKNKVLKPGDMVVTASGQYPCVIGTTDTIKVRML